MKRLWLVSLISSTSRYTSVICESKYNIIYETKASIFNDAVCDASIHTFPNYFSKVTYTHGLIRHAKFFVANIYMDPLIYLPVIAPFSLLSRLAEALLWTGLYDRAK